MIEKLTVVELRFLFVLVSWVNTWTFKPDLRSLWLLWRAFQRVLNDPGIQETTFLTPFVASV